MKTVVKTFISYGNSTLIQFETMPKSVFFFKPGGPEILTGGLTISEFGGNGVVGKLLALNNTGNFLLLTDADVLSGAKQNRVLNKSVLLAPFSKTIIDVSCVERGRWQYTTRHFSSPATTADPDLRKAKAQALSDSNFQPRENFRAQQTVWSHISHRLFEEGVASSTENYSDLIAQKREKQKHRFPFFEPENGCNGLAVMVNKEIVCVDLFGTEMVYQHYFPKLRDSAFLQALIGKVDLPVNEHEAHDKVVEMMDQHEMAGKRPDISYTGAGLLSVRIGNQFSGVDLECDGQLIHRVVFGK